MGRDGKPTRDKILAESRELIYENGFAGTSIDLILERTGITKGAFFYHFKTKAELAKELMKEFAAADMHEMERVLAQTDQYTDPKERLLQFIQCFIDMFSGLEDPPNCLYASVSNERNQYSDEIKEMVHSTMLEWRRVFERMIDDVLKSYELKKRVDKVALADHFNVVMEGAFIVSKALNAPELTANQLIQLKSYFELLLE